IELRVTDATGNEIPRDGQTVGALNIRGPWVAAAYFGESDGQVGKSPGWFNTGDVVNIDAEGFVQIVDRSKDLIKSGGEWINSIELENIALAHSAIKECAVVARADPRWGERPVLVVVLREASQLAREDLLALYLGKVPKWSVPDEVIIVRELPHTATGKISK